MTPEEELVQSIPVAIRREANYVVAGSGPPLLLLHGLNMGWGQWYPNITFLAQDHTVYALDLPGSGNSALLSASDPEFASKLVDAVQDFIRLQNWPQVDVIGHSLGAWVALKVAARGEVPIRKIIAVSPMGFSERTPAKYRPLGFYWLANIFSRTVMRPSLDNMREFATSVLKHPEKLSEKFVRYYHHAVAHRGHDHPFLWINSFAGPLRLREQFLLTPAEREAIRVPVHVLLGEHDPIVPPGEHPQDVFRLPLGTLAVIPDAGHVPPTEQPELFYSAVVQFL